MWWVRRADQATGGEAWTAPCVLRQCVPVEGRAPRRSGAAGRAEVRGVRGGVCLTEEAKPVLFASVRRSAHATAVGGAVK